MNAPTLLIGLGGVGSKIVERVSKMTSADERSNISCAVFDTDINELRGIQKRNPFIKIIQTSTKQTVGEYLQKDNYARDTWFPVHAILNQKTLTEGAGQVRSISRLAFDSVVRAGKMEPLHEAIQELYKVEEDKIDQALRVVITGSLVGGTGSGLILPVALYVRNYLKTHFRQSANITRGFFILPEVFFEAIQGPTERNTLKANAYATLRELDAFLMKADGTLHERFSDSVKIEFPKVAQEGYEEYEVSPYDFCFLFDAQNAEGGKLNSFNQYLDHAANCIYAQSIGPMNKRSNSSEDNTIRKLAKERGRNRYAGAGVSMLIYPYRDIKKMIALKWTKQSISQEWLYYDNLYNELCIENEKLRAEGLAVKEQELSEYYVNQIESDNKADNRGFAKMIYRYSGRYKNSVRRESDSWTTYVEAVLNKIEDDIEAGSSEINDKLDTATKAITELGNDWGDFLGAYNEIEEYKEMSDRYVQDVSHTIAHSLFKGSSKSIENGHDYELVTHLVDSENVFIHPNAVRYVLIKILSLIKQHKKMVDSERQELKEYVDGFEDHAFDDAKTEDIVETKDDLVDRKKPFISRLTKRPSGEQEDMKRKFRDLLHKISELQKENAKSIVLGKGISFFDSLVSSFESFFKSMEINIDTLDTRIDDIYKRYSDRKGSTIRYVCSSEKALDKILSQKVFTGNANVLKSDLSKKIFENVLEYSLNSDFDNDGKKINYHNYFSDIFETDIIGHFEDSVPSDLDLDIVSAIEKEAELVGEFDERVNIRESIRQYVIKIISDTRKLACPFIETPLGESQDPINSCTFNKELEPQRGDESPRAILINKELMNYGGEPDEDISKYMIMFYKSYYGLRANNLSKFAPPEKAQTYNRTGGEYFKSYFDLIRGIYPKTEKSKEINPHIDCRWHLVSKLPDLDEENQKKQEQNVYAAFFWALLNKYVTYSTKAGNQKEYRIKKILFGLDDDELIVSNGTECDNLYEVLDAMMMYPLLVEKILEKVQFNIEYDVNERKSIDDGILFNNLENFRIVEPLVGKGNEQAKSVFDLPMLMKKSALPELYFEENVIELLKVEIKEIKRYLDNFYAENEVPVKLYEIIKKQFEIHLETLEKEREIAPNILQESLFEQTIEVIIVELEKYKLNEEKEEFIQTVEAFMSKYSVL